jgi:5'-3' exonuclease
MGVTNLFKEVKPVISKTTIKKLAKEFGVKKVALDLSCQFHQYVKGSQYIRADSHGNIVNHLSGLITLVNSLHNSGIINIIGVLDNPKPNIWKVGELAKRKTARKKIEKKMVDMDDTDIVTKQKYQKQIFTITKSMVVDAKCVLNMLGIDVYVTPAGFEAEQLCAQLQRMGAVDAVITNDSDACSIFGATIIRKNLGTPYYSMYTMQNILEEHKLTSSELIECCIHMGCDFSGSGTKGVGFKSYLKLKDTIKLSEHQQTIKKYVLSEVPRPEIIAGYCDPDRLTNWLITQRNFAEKTVKKYIQSMRIMDITDSPDKNKWIDEHLPYREVSDIDEGDDDLSDLSESSCD